MQSRDPFVKPTAIEDLRPTQITVGMREVAMKQHEWRQEHAENGAEFLGRHMIPVVSGPKNPPMSPTITTWRSLCTGRV